jgi:hypothetical protein
MKVSPSGFLVNYRVHFYVILAERLVSTTIFCLAALNPGGNTYLIFIRIYLAQWTVNLFILVVVELRLGIQMRRKLKSLGAEISYARVRNI